jgi:hypothetical protein
MNTAAKLKRRSQRASPTNTLIGNEIRFHMKRYEGVTASGARGYNQVNTNKINTLQKPERGSPVGTKDKSNLTVSYFR